MEKTSSSVEERKFRASDCPPLSTKKKIMEQLCEPIENRPSRHQRSVISFERLEIEPGRRRRRERRDNIPHENLLPDPEPGGEEWRSPSKRVITRPRDPPNKIPGLRGVPGSPVSWKSVINKQPSATAKTQSSGHPYFSKGRPNLYIYIYINILYIMYVHF